ncbi:TatA/E family twin arginine-targeting protein translocase [Vulcanococcus limneticus]|uniref:TatA/E family twin arginine-targeting protein translocase n=1 Tax=Vulcanococcus limneticus TaxID=2170428 RepID=UPI001E2A2952|nr:TatA/E family twin arginine-targeting protein translocase [Vulcanococcus limneticus]
MNFFGIGLPELAVIAAIGLLVFGPKRLPELGRTLGRTLKGFQSASREFEQEFRKVVDTVEAEVNSSEPAVADSPVAPASAGQLAAAPVTGAQVSVADTGSLARAEAEALEATAAEAVTVSPVQPAADGPAA